MLLDHLDGSRDIGEARMTRFVILLGIFVHPAEKDNRSFGGHSKVTGLRDEARLRSIS